MKNMKIKINLVIAVLLVLTGTVAGVGLGVSPASFTVSDALKGGEYERTFTTYNTDNETGDFTFNAQGDGAEWLSYYLPEGETPISTITIEGKSSQKILVKINIPEEAANGNYTPKIYIKSVPKELEATSGAVAQAVVQIPVSATINVTGTQILTGIVKDISLNDIEIDYPLRIKVEFENTGNVIAKPTITVIIRSNTDNSILSEEVYSDTEIKPDTTDTIIIEHDTEGLEVGEYFAEITVTLNEAVLAQENIPFEILEHGTLSRQGVLSKLDIEGDTLVNRVVKIHADFKNTGMIDSKAKFIGEIYLENNQIDIVESEELNVPVGETDTLISYLKIEESGNYIIKGKVFYEGKTTEVEELSFKVPAVDSSSVPGFGLLLTMFVMILVISFKRKW